MPTSLEIILAPEGGTTPLDREIASTQGMIKSAGSLQQGILMEKLGWIFVAKARLSNDPGYYKLAEQCAAWLQAKSPQDPSGLLLRGHILDALHRFHEAEAAGRQLVTLAPHSWESFALLGDALMEQGRLDEAIATYQTMVDIRPCAQTYLRVAHMRWLKGDLPGAMETARLAVEAGSTRDPEPAAWAYTRLASYQWQSQDTAGADWSLNRAVQFVPQYAPALLLRGRMLLFQNKPADAEKVLETAAAENPLPDYRWTLADAQQAAGQPAEAGRTEASLGKRGAVDDPRTYSLFLSTRNAQADSGAADAGLKLAQAELETRRDIFTRDAVAWAFLAAGKVQDAQSNMEAALAEGTQDARLFLHAGVIARAAGQPGAAASFLQKASALQQTLLPSERGLLAQNLQALSKNQSTTNPQTAAAKIAPPGHS